MTELGPAWARLEESGCVAGTWGVEGPDGGHLETAYYGVSDALPGIHVIAFAPAGWTEADLGFVTGAAPWASTPLTPRELDVLQLAAQGLSGPQIADQLVVSVETVKTHFVNVYAKLGVRDRAAAVAMGMRLGLID